MVKKVAKILSLEGKPKGKLDLPPVFGTPLRADVIRRTVLAIQSHRLQPQGRNLMAGKRTSAESRGTGGGIARLPRRKGGDAKAAFAPGTVGGRQAHPPLSEKSIAKKISKKEKRLALFSAVAATASKHIVASRGHHVEDVTEFPLVVTDEFEALTKTKEAEEALVHLGLLADIFRAREGTRVRAGKGKSRGRKMKRTTGPLVVVAENNGIVEAARNVPGVDIVTVADLNVEMLAPGARPGRLTVWTSSAIEKLGELWQRSA